MLYEIKVPETGFGIAEATIVEWYKKVGDNIEEGEVILSVETEKVNVEIPSPASGILKEINFHPDDVVPVCDVLGVISTEAENESQPSDQEVATKKIKISQLAKKIAKTNGIDLDTLTSGTGPGGRITKDDILKIVENKKNTPSTPSAIIEKPAPQPTPASLPVGEKIPLTSWRKVIAERMTSSWREIPHHAQSVDIDVSMLSQYLAETKGDKSIPRLTYLPFLMKAIQAGIKITPEINAYSYEDHFVLQKDLNIGIAVDVDGKLLVPVIKNVQKKSILELAEELSSVVQKTRSNTLTPQDVQGGTLTLSNVGALGLYSGFSIIVPPQTSIICMGAVRDVASVENGSIEIRKKMFVTNSYDHRAVHGGPASRFFIEMKNKLENLNSLLLQLH